jgi:hypothetical protein
MLYFMLYRSVRMKKTDLLLLVCAAMLTQCDGLNKPVGVPSASAAERRAVKELKITRPPYPNTFALSDAGAGGLPQDKSWEKDYGLEVSGISGSGKASVLAPDAYTVESADPSAIGRQAVTVKLNGTPGSPDITASFYISIVSSSVNYYRIMNYEAAGGSLVPVPSRAMAGERVTVYVYPAKGFFYKNNSFSINSRPEDGPVTTNDDGSLTFIMPDCDVAPEALFFEAAASLKTATQDALYYETLQEAFESACLTEGAFPVSEPVNGILLSTDLTEGAFPVSKPMNGILLSTNTRAAAWSEEGDVVITVFGDAVIDRAITVKNKIRLVAADGKVKTIRRGTIDGSPFVIEDGGALELDAGLSLGLTLDGGADTGKTGGALVTVSGGTLEMGARILLQNNANTEGQGGGVYVENGTLIMTDGSIRNNSAKYGGGVYVSKDGKADLSEQALISGNEAAEKGAGVYTDGAFSLSGSAVVAQNNDVYLTKDTVITVGASLSPNQNAQGGNPALSAKITTEEKSGNAGIIKGTSAEIVSAAMQKVATGAGAPATAVVYQGGEFVIVMQDETSETAPGQAVAQVNGVNLYFASLQDAVSMSGGGTADSPAVITLAQDLAMAAAPIAIESGRHIKMKATEAGVTINRATGYTKRLFTVSSGASLELDGNAGALVLDGGSVSGTSGTSSLIYVNGGTLTMNGEVVLKNNKMGGVDGGAIYLESGVFTMNGGIIENNTTTYGGGGVYMSNGIFNLSGGTIQNNSAGQGGGIAVTHGKLNMSSGAILNNTTTGFMSGGGGGVLLETSSVVFTMSSGTIAGNSSSTKGGGVYVYSSGATFTKIGGTIYGSDASDGAKNTAASGGAALYNVGTLPATTDDTF